MGLMNDGVTKAEKLKTGLIFEVQDDFFMFLASFKNYSEYFESKSKILRQKIDFLTKKATLEPLQKIEEFTENYSFDRI